MAESAPEIAFLHYADLVNKICRNFAASFEREALLNDTAKVQNDGLIRRDEKKGNKRK